MTDRLVIADARTTTSADFLDAIAPLFGKPTKADQQKQAEIAAALAEHQTGMQRTYAIPKLWDQIVARAALKNEHNARVREIEERYESMERALIFGAFMNSLSAPTPAQLWLERAAAQLDRERDPDGSKQANRADTIAKLLQRDGHDCWFCGRNLGTDISIEHLQPRALGGNWGEGNLALAHKGCNKAAGHLSRVKKEALREEMRAGQSLQENQEGGEFANNGSPIIR